MEVLHKVDERGTTPWKLKMILKDYEEDRGDDVKALIALLKVWCIMTATKATPPDCSNVALPLPVVRLPLAQLQRAAAL